jgi:hypothetical protein
VDFSGKNITEKQDPSLPDIFVDFGVHTVVCKSHKYTESVTALNFIKRKIEKDYYFDPAGMVCLIEIGKRN